MGELAIKIASKFHENWRETRKQPDGQYEPRWKEIKDDYFFEQMNLIKLRSRDNRVHDEAVEALNEFAGGKYPFEHAMVDADFVDKLYQLRLSERLFLEDGVYHLDIANCSFEELTADWQEENLAAAEVIEKIIQNEKTTGVVLSENEVGKIIHNEWLSRNEWAKNEPLGVDFEQLSKEEQDKDIEQYKIGKQMEAELNKEIEGGLQL